MNDIHIKNESILEFRNTPWDERAFNLETKEILRLKNGNENDVNLLLLELENEIEGKGLIYFRANSSDNELKKILFKNNYYIAESALKLSNAKVQKMNFKEIFKNSLELDNKLISTDKQQLKNIAITAFNYSRFHEDPFLDRVLSNKRYENWIDDLLSQNKELLIYRNSQNEIISFMFYEFIGIKKVNLILGGSKNDFGMITPSFFASVMIFLQNRGIKKIDVVISVSNIVVFNIYSNLGFFVKASMFDYHKMIQKEDI